MLFDVLKKYDLETVDKCKDVLPIIIECFEADSLKYFGSISDLPLIMLMGEASVVKATVLLPYIATFAHGIGPTQSLIFHPIFFNLAKMLKL